MTLVEFYFLDSMLLIFSTRYTRRVAFSIPSPPLFFLALTLMPKQEENGRRGEARRDIVLFCFESVGGQPVNRDSLNVHHGDGRNPIDTVTREKKESAESKI